MLVELVGTEALSLELFGTVPVSRARALTGDLTPEASGDRSVVSLLVFRMTGMHARGLPLPAFDYGEALWRIGVHFEGGSAWLAHRCDLDHPLVLRLGRTAIRYPVRPARFQFVDAENECTFKVETTDGRLSVLVTTDGRSPPPEAPRRALARVGDRLFEIPWHEDPGPQRNLGKIVWRERSLGQTTLGDDVVWSDDALVLRGRTHRCGLARRLA